MRAARSPRCPPHESRSLSPLPTAVSALFGGGLGAFLGLRKGTGGTIARSVFGSLANKVAVGTYTKGVELVEAAKEYDREAEVVKGVTKAGKAALDELQKKIKEGL